MLIMQIEHWVMTHETYIRLGFFLGILGAIGLLELLYPKRVLTGRKSVRWLNHLGLVVLNSLLRRLIFPAVAVGLRLEYQFWLWISSFTCSMCCSMRSQSSGDCIECITRTPILMSLLALDFIRWKFFFQWLSNSQLS